MRVVVCYRDDSQDYMGGNISVRVGPATYKLEILAQEHELPADKNLLIGNEWALVTKAGYNAATNSLGVNSQLMVDKSNLQHQIVALKEAHAREIAQLKAQFDKRYSPEAYEVAVACAKMFSGAAWFDSRWRGLEID